MSSKDRNKSGAGKGDANTRVDPAKFRAGMELLQRCGKCRHNVHCPAGPGDGCPRESKA